MKKASGSNVEGSMKVASGTSAQTVGALWERARSRNPKLGREEFLSELDALVSQGSVKLEEPHIRHFQEYAWSWRYGLRAWLTLLSIVLALAIVEMFNAYFPLVLIRWA